jgi:hypothetical protein
VAVLRRMPRRSGSQNGPDSVKTKGDVMKFLKDSFTYVQRAVGTINDHNLLKPIK